MCELISRSEKAREVGMVVGKEYNLPIGGQVADIPAMDDVVLQCWHPETEEWSTMLSPVEGMAWQLSPGSKLRLVKKEGADAPAPSMVKQVEAVGRT